MRILRLVALFALLVFADSFDLLLAGRAYAGCCMCGTCDSGCTCPGAGRCAWCAAPLSKDLQLSATFSDRSSGGTAVSETVPSVAVNPQSVDRLIRKIGAGQCARNTFRLNLISSEVNVLESNQATFTNHSTVENMAGL